MKRINLWLNLALITQLGLSMLIPIVGGVFIGRYLDDRLDTAPWLLLGLTLIGVLGAFRNLYYLSTRAASSKGRDHDDHNEKNSSNP